MNQWETYPTQAGKSTVVGDLRILRGVHSPQLGNMRDILAWLPPSYGTSNRAYPVIYMHDGHNLFDASVGFSGEWQVDETMTALAQEGDESIIIGIPNNAPKIQTATPSPTGQEAIIIGIPNNTERRIEYSPYPYRLQGVDYAGKGDDYMRFIVDTLKPLVDSSFRTLPDAAHTGIAGSSMGGLISLYGFLMYPHVFGFCGAFSTAYWFEPEPDAGLVATIRAHARGIGRVYVDVGTAEGPTLNGWGFGDAGLDELYVAGVHRVLSALKEAGYQEGDNLLYVEEAGAPHHESAWARRLPTAMRFLLKNLG